MRSSRAVLTTLLAAVLLLAATGAGAAAGPKLREERRALKTALRCSGPVDGLSRDVVLLLPGTWQEPDTNYDWNWMPALTDAGYTWCGLELPLDTTDDAQESGELIAAAIRNLYRRSGRTVDVVGYSQGGMVPRWALKWWPDTRAMVDDVIGLAPSNHGTLDAEYCGDCVPAVHQQQATSAFIAALNADAETWAGIDYTVAYTLLDEVVTPNSVPGAASSELRTGEGTISNIPLQSVCPSNTADHLSIGTYDPVAYAIAIDALSHDGPADGARVLAEDPTLCTQVLMPGVDETTFAEDYAAYVAFTNNPEGDAETVLVEPPLKPYAQ